MIHSVILPTMLDVIPALSRHSTTVPVIDVVAVATAVEFSWQHETTVTSTNVKGPHAALTVTGGL